MRKAKQSKAYLRDLTHPPQNFCEPEIMTQEILRNSLNLEFTNHCLHLFNIKNKSSTKMCFNLYFLSKMLVNSSIRIINRQAKLLEEDLIEHYSCCIQITQLALEKEIQV